MNAVLIGERGRLARGFWRLAKTIFEESESETLSTTPETGVLPDLVSRLHPWSSYW